MTVKKPVERADRDPAPAQPEGKKSWHKRTPGQVLQGEMEELRRDIAKTETEQATKRRQLEKLEQACKVFEE